MIPWHHTKHTYWNGLVTNSSPVCGTSMGGVRLDIWSFLFDLPEEDLFLCILVREPMTQITEEVRDQLLEASAATRKAYSTYRREADSDDHYSAAEGAQSAADKSKDDLEMSAVITIMQPILRFLQLLCENHNRDLQVSVIAEQLRPHRLAWSLQRGNGHKLEKSI